MMHAGLKTVKQELIGTYEADLEKVKKELMDTLLETGDIYVYVGFILLDTVVCMCIESWSLEYRLVSTS